MNNDKNSKKLPDSIDESNIDPDFEIREANSGGSEFVGGAKKFSDEDNDALELETPSASADESFRASESPDYTSFVGPQKQEEKVVKDSDNESTLENLKEEKPSSDKNKSLSSSQISEIKNKLYNTDLYLSEKEKENLLSKIGASAESSGKSNNDEITLKSTISEQLSKKQLNRPAPVSPKMAPRTKGIAYFWNNYIQMIGASDLRSGNSISFNDREYTLQKKTFNNKAKMIIYGSLFGFALIVIGSFFISSTTGEGSVVGVVYKTNNKPYLKGATIKFPELGIEKESNAQGFFTSENMPSGAHKLDLYLDGILYNTNYITVADGQVATISLSLKKEEKLVQENDDLAKSAKPRTNKVASSPSPKRQTVARTTPGITEKSKSKSKSSNTVSSQPAKPARLVLKANVQGAKIKLGYNILGAGNLTYSNIKPGTYNYRISKDGYEDATGKITLRSGQKQSLAVSLTPIAPQVKEITFDAHDYYLSGVTALNEKDYEQAVADLSQSISMDPGSADAWYSRGKTFAKLNQEPDAHDNFIRSAEMYQFKREYNSAFKSYGQALKSDSKSMTALLGRGNLYLKRKQERAALADFEAALHIDKKNFAANFGMGKVRFEQKNYKKAIKYFKKSRKINDQNPLVYQYLMLSYMGKDDFKNVKKSFEKFEKVASNNEMDRFENDNKFVAIRRVIKMNN